MKVNAGRISVPEISPSARIKKELGTKNLHVIPEKDIKEHMPSTICWCHPHCSNLDTISLGFEPIYIHRKYETSNQQDKTVEK